jgi:hypothetical protein
VLEAYVSLRRATGQPGLLDQTTRIALLVTTATACDSHYAQAILSALAIRSGWRQDQVDALLAGKDLGEPKANALIGVIREAAAGSGRVADRTWDTALRAGWTDQHLAEAFGYLGLAALPPTSSTTRTPSWTSLRPPDAANGHAWRCDGSIPGAPAGSSVGSG